MIKRTLYFGNPAYLSMQNSQMLLRLPAVVNNIGLSTIIKKEAERSFPIEDLGVVVIDHRQITVTHDLVEQLTANNVALIWCDEKHHPQSLTLPLAANHTHMAKVQYQINATEPLKKQIWKQTVETKILNQASVLTELGHTAKDLVYMAKNVQSGDPSNVEARAAVVYWRKLLDPYRVRRGQDEGPPNHLLNYGYAILRATVARSLLESGLLPMLGVHHHNQYNHFCLADDIMEPYRPFVDLHVFEYLATKPNLTENLSEADKYHLLSVPALDVCIGGKKSPLMVALQRTTSSLVKVFTGESRQVLYPKL